MTRRHGLALVLAGAVGVAVACGGGIGGSGGAGSFGGPSPWGTTNAVYGLAQGILESPVIGATTDESQNLWVATPQALYLMKPGGGSFHRFDARDGLHLSGNPVSYCDSWAPAGYNPCPASGAGLAITEIEGGAAGEVFVGYAGIDTGLVDFSDPDTSPNRHTGKLDRVRLTASGSLQVDRFDFHSSNTAEFWHDRTVQRLLYDHAQHAHELYAGTNHGVVRLQPDRWAADQKGQWFITADAAWMSDHLHPQVCYHRACGTSETGLMLGDWKGLALSADGNLWVGGRWTAGQIRWTQDIAQWLPRPGNEIYAVAFGDPYPQGDCSGFCNQPVFLVPAEGDTISLQAVAVARDGTVWFASGRTQDSDTPWGLAKWDGRTFHYVSPSRDLGLPTDDVRDLVALPDGRLALALADAGVAIWDPASSKVARLRGDAGLSDDHVVRLKLDARVSPATLYVATSGGAAAIRSLP